jgi:enoyl-CoA hydratase/carnithine racemase
MPHHIKTETVSRVLIVRLDRPEKKNALTIDMYESMAEALRQGEADADVRAVLITGTADCFTAGNDLIDFANAPSGGPSSAIIFLETLAASEKPVLAAVNGMAIGIGTTLLFHCDLVYAGAGARFQLPFVNLGLCPEAGSSLTLPSLLGHQRAAELLFFGEPFSAQTACGLNLINEVFPDDQVFSQAMIKARQLAAKPPAALRATKALLKDSRASLIAEAMHRETERFASLLHGPEAREAIVAFMERRKPDFSKF